MRLVSSKPVGQRRVYDIEVDQVHNFYANGINVHNCATNGGVSVIKDDGTVVDLYQGTDTFEYSRNIDFTPDGRLVFDQSSSTAPGRYCHVAAIPSSDISNVYEGFQPDGSRWNRLYILTPQAQSYTTNLPKGINNHFGEKMLSVSSTMNVYGSDGDTSGSAGGLTLLSYNPDIIPTTTNAAEGMVSYITSSYNTGWMNGDIKLATLSDTDDTDVTGSNLISGDAASDDTNSTGSWSNTGLDTFSSQSSTVSTGTYALQFDSNTSATTGAVAALNLNSILTVGKTYTISFDSRHIGSGGSWSARLSNTTGGTYNALITNIGASNVTFQSHSITFTYATGKNMDYLTFREASSVNTGGVYVDNLQIRLAEDDRSVNGNGLQVFGTVTKNPVATGADLVAYSGWSSSNYLLQPHNSDIDDIGTGEFMFMTWIKGTSHFNNIISYEYHDGSSWQQLTRLEGGATEGTVRLRVSSSGSYVTSTSTIHDGSWHLVAGVRRAGGIAEIYVDGRLEASITGQTYSISNDNAGVILGPDYRAHSGASPAVGSGTLALVRISATAPSAEQIAKIYEDEKVLFQENAQATLYGSSDAVTALAYDDDTNLLHVGTSSGRSDFNGLRRVNNTTDAVGAAISASNGLVAED